MKRKPLFRLVYLAFLMAFSTTLAVHAQSRPAVILTLDPVTIQCSANPSGYYEQVLEGCGFTPGLWGNLNIVAPTFLGALGTPFKIDSSGCVYFDLDVPCYWPKGSYSYKIYEGRSYSSSHWKLKGTAGFTIY